MITEQFLARSLVESYGRKEYKPWKLYDGGAICFLYLSRAIFRETSPTEMDLIRISKDKTTTIFHLLYSGGPCK